MESPDLDLQATLELDRNAFCATNQGTPQLGFLAIMDIASHSAPPLDEQEAQRRQTHVESWISQQNAAGFGVDQHMATALNAYLAGLVSLPELLTELRRPYLH